MPGTPQHWAVLTKTRAVLLNWAGLNSEGAGERLKEKASLRQHHPFSWRRTSASERFVIFFLPPTSKTTSLPSCASAYVIYPEKGNLEKRYKVLPKHEAQVSLLAKQLPRTCLNMRLSEMNVAAGAIAIVLKASLHQATCHEIEAVEPLSLFLVCFECAPLWFQALTLLFPGVEFQFQGKNHKN